MWTAENFGLAKGTSSAATSASVHVLGISGRNTLAARRKVSARMGTTYWHLTNRSIGGREGECSTRIRRRRRRAPPRRPRVAALKRPGELQKKSASPE